MQLTSVSISQNLFHDIYDRIHQKPDSNTA